MSDVPNTFRALLSTKTDEVERPRAIADGHYLGVIKSIEYGVSRNKQTPYVRLKIQVTSETDDVPSDENSGIDLSRRELNKDYFITPTALYRISDMLDAVLGKQSGRSFDERIPELRGHPVMMKVGHRDSEDGQERYNEVGTLVAPAG